MQRTLQKVERKRLNAEVNQKPDARRDDSATGTVHSITPIGKEITVDPTDTDEDFTAAKPGTTPHHSTAEKLEFAVRKIAVTHPVLDRWAVVKKRMGRPSRGPKRKSWATNWRLASLGSNTESGVGSKRRSDHD